MRKLRTLPVLAAAVVGLLIVTGELAATLVLDDDDSDERAATNTAAVSTPTQAPSPTSTTSATESDAPDGISDELRARLQDLPQKLQDDLISRFEAGTLGVATIETVIEEYENRNQGVRVGTVVEATDSMLRLEVYTTGERAEVVLNDETVLRRGRDDITGADLEPDKLVMVISRDGGVTAFAVTAFGVGAP